MRQRLIPSPEFAVFGQIFLQRCGGFRRALLEIRLEAEFRRVADANAGAFLHTVIDEQNVAAFACDEERSAEGVAVDLAANAEASAVGPSFLYVERNADDRPTKPGG